MDVRKIFGFRKKAKTSKLEKAGEDKNKEAMSSQEVIPTSIPKCMELVKSIFGGSSDIIIQPIETQRAKGMVVYIDGLTNKDLVDRDIIAPLKSEDFDGNIALAIKTYYKEVDDVPTFVGEVLQGNVGLFYDGSREIFVIDFKQWDKRTVETPDAESVTRGPREGFTESIRTNTALLRRKIRTPKLIVENVIVGRQSNTPIGITYIEGIVNREVLQEVKRRISTIDTDAVLESGNIEQYIDENTFSPASGMGTTVKPDVVAAKILEGRVAIFCDGSPHVLIIPALFLENIQTSEDYYNRVLLAFIQRILRFLGLFITVLLPGLTLAVITYNQEMIPSVFLISLISSTQKTPLPAGAELFFLIVMFELLKEAGTRLPKTVGSAITIVGALIIGDSAVNAGIVGAPAVIIVALTAVTSFIAPNLTEYILVYRLLFLVLGGMMGLIGIGTGVVILLTQLISTTSFGIPILSSFSKNELKDSAVRFPLWSLRYRPSSIAKDNVRRRK